MVLYIRKGVKVMMHELERNECGKDMAGNFEVVNL